MSPSAGNQLVCFLTVYIHLIMKDNRVIIAAHQTKHQNQIITRNSGYKSLGDGPLFCFFYFYMQPGSDWRDVLILSGHVGWLLSLYAALRQKFSREGYWLDCPIAVSARKLIVQFCSLTGTVFLFGISVSLSTFMQFHMHFLRTTIFKLIIMLPVFFMRHGYFNGWIFQRC